MYELNAPGLETIWGGRGRFSWLILNEMLTLGLERGLRWSPPLFSLEIPPALGKLFREL